MTTPATPTPAKLSNIYMVERRVLQSVATACITFPQTRPYITTILSNIDWTPRPRSSSHDLTCLSSRPNWRQLGPCWEGLEGNHERQRACANTACSKARQIGMKYTKKDPRSWFLLYACYRSLAGKAFGHDTGIYIFKGVCVCHPSTPSSSLKVRDEEATEQWS